MDKVPQQEDIFTAFDRRQAGVGAIGQPDHLGEAVVEFPQFDGPEVEAVVQKQTEINVPKPMVVGSKTFNVNDLIKKGLFDAAEYFLGRPLTADEKLEGLSSKTESLSEQKLVLNQGSVNIEAAMMKSLAKLVAKMSHGRRRRGHRGHDDDDDDEDYDEDDDDDDDDGDRARGDEAKESDAEDYEFQMEPETRDRFIAAYGQKAFDKIKNKNRNNWTTKELDMYINILPGASPDPPTAAIRHPATRIAVTRAPGQPDDSDDESIDTTIYSPTVLSKPLGGKYKERLDEIIPEYNPDKEYSAVQAKAMLGQLKIEFHRFKPASQEAKRKSALFSAFPKSQNKENMTEKLHAARKELVKLIQEEAARKDEASGKPMTAKEKKLAQDEEESGGEPLVAHGVVKKKHALGLEWVPFGSKWMISPDRLAKEDVVSIVKKSNLQKIQKHPNKTVSAAVKVCLTEFLAGRPMPVELLTPEEKVWLDWLFDDATITMKKRPVDKLTVVKTPKQMRERLAVLFGELAEGPNDSPLVLNEFRTLFRQACMRGILDKNQVEIGREFLPTFK